MNLSANVQFREAAVTSIAGTSSVNGAVFDMSRYEGILFICKFGTAAADNSIKAQQDSAVGMGGAADLEGSLVGLGGASDEIVALDLYKPMEQFVRMVAVRGTSTTLDWAVAIQYDKRGVLPAVNSIAGIQAHELVVSPAEGTA